MRSGLIWRLAAIALFAGSVNAAASDRASLVGDFDSESDTGPVPRYEIILWRQGDQLVGLFREINGTEGDPPTTTITQGRIRPAGVVSFAALIESGLHSCDRHRQVRGKTVYHFSGRVDRRALAGELRVYDDLHPGLGLRTMSIRVPRLNARSLAFASRAPWREHVAWQLGLSEP